VRLLAFARSATMSAVDLDELTDRVVQGPWPDRVAAIRSVPAEFAGKEHAQVYAEVGRAFYAEKLAPHFHLIAWPEKFLDRPGFFAAYHTAAQATADFTSVTPATIEDAIRADPRALRIFRLITGYTPNELAFAAGELAGVKVGAAAIERLEGGGRPAGEVANAIGPLSELLAAIVGGQGGFQLAPELVRRGFRGKTDKPDTEAGWQSVEQFHREGTPYAELLYQRFYGGTFRQLQDAAGTRKGDLLEDATEELFAAHGVPYLRTIPGTQATAGQAFGITVHPAPDFILHDGSSARGLLECKSASDGGTARDKAGRFRGLRTEASRLGGIPVLAVLEGLGWRRLNDALGPVIRECDGRVFSLGNLDELLEVDPVRDLVGTSA